MSTFFSFFFLNFNFKIPRSHILSPWTVKGDCYKKLKSLAVKESQKKWKCTEWPINDIERYMANVPHIYVKVLHASPTFHSVLLYNRFFFSDNWGFWFPDRVQW